MDVPSGPNIIYRNFVSVQKIEDRMSLQGLYRMSKDGVYPSMRSFLSFLGDVEFEASGSRSNFRV